MSFFKHNPFGMEDPLESWYPIIIALIVGAIMMIKTYFGGPECPSHKDIENKIVLITGGSSGIGLQTAVELAKRKAIVVIAARNVTETAKQLQVLGRKLVKPKFIVKKLDLSSFESVKKFVKDLEYSKIDILINNAGIMYVPNEIITEDDLEYQLQVNYFSHFLLFHLLLPKLKESDSCRVMNVTCNAANVVEIDHLDVGKLCDRSREYVPRDMYALSKFCLSSMALYISKCLPSNVTFNLGNPGITRSNHLKNLFFETNFIFKLSFLPFKYIFFRSPKEASNTIVYLAVDESLNKISGKLIFDCQIADFPKNYCDEDLNERIYLKSCQITGVDPLSIVD